jgi:plastocyanin
VRTSSHPPTRLIFLLVLIVLLITGGILWFIIINKPAITAPAIPTLPPATPTPGFTPATAFGQPVDMTANKHVVITIVDAPETSSCHPACFAIPNVKVRVGTTITWLNKSKTFHSVTALQGTSLTDLTAAPQIFDSGFTTFVNPGQSFSYTVTMPAYNLHPDHTIVYFCRVHPSMGAELTIVL